LGRSTAQNVHPRFDGASSTSSHERPNPIGPSGEPTSNLKSLPVSSSASPPVESPTSSGSHGSGGGSNGPLPGFVPDSVSTPLALAIGGALVSGAGPHPSATPTAAAQSLCTPGRGASVRRLTTDPP
jgi:hypothetical protein